MHSAAVEMTPASVPPLAPGAAFAPTNRVTPRSAASDEGAPIMRLQPAELDSAAGKLDAVLDAIDVNQDGMYVGL